MHRLRALIFRHRRLVAMLLALTLVIKALVPAGYMLDTQGSGLTIRVCTDQTGQDLVRQIAVPAATKSQTQHKAMTDQPCAFSVLSHAVLGGADPLLLAAALVFIMAMGLIALVPRRLAPHAHLRPPLRGPPALV